MMVSSNSFDVVGARACGFRGAFVDRYGLPYEDTAFQPDVDEILRHSGEHTKILFLCSPNNPTGNLLDRSLVLELLEGFPGLVVIDEQHRFGVHQRLALRDKGRDGRLLPHQLIMTATPIPRTLAMAFYADLDVSVIDELPPGRTPVQTVALPDSRRDEVIQRIRESCRAGRQAYWVCTLIEESESLQAQAARQGRRSDVRRRARRVCRAIALRGRGRDGRAGARRRETGRRRVRRRRTQRPQQRSRLDLLRLRRIGTLDRHARINLPRSRRQHRRRRERTGHHDAPDQIRRRRRPRRRSGNASGSQRTPLEGHYRSLQVSEQQYS